eukprot:SAG22_NODE_1472_length_4342_cov_3.211171_4_plen_455_part_00
MTFADGKIPEEFSAKQVRLPGDTDGIPVLLRMQAFHGEKVTTGVANALVITHVMQVQGQVASPLGLEAGINDLVPQLPPGKRYHFFLCHHQSSGGDQCSMLCHGLKQLGFQVWYDNDQQAIHRNLQGMQDGVKASMCLLIFLSGRMETEGRADLNGQYEGPFTRYFCHVEMAAAHEAQLRCVGVMESEERHGQPDFLLEKSRALSGKDGGQIHPEAHLNVALLDTVCFIPFRRQAHDTKAMLIEIARQVQTADFLPSRERSLSGPEPALEPEPQPELEPGPKPKPMSQLQTHKSSEQLAVETVAEYLHTAGIRPERALDLSRSLVDEGYDEVEQINEMEDDELRECGLKGGDLSKLKKFRQSQSPGLKRAVEKSVMESIEDALESITSSMADLAKETKQLQVALHKAEAARDAAAAFRAAAGTDGAKNVEMEVQDPPPADEAEIDNPIDGRHYD